MGVYVIQKEGAEPEDDPEDVGVVIEGVEANTDLGNIAQACALLFGLIYCLNLSYPPELKCTFEVLQKILLNLDGQKLSSKVQFLKNKLMGWEHLKMTDRSWMVHWCNGDFQYIMLIFELFIFFFFHLKHFFLSFWILSVGQFTFYTALQMIFVCPYIDGSKWIRSTDRSTMLCLCIKVL